MTIDNNNKISTKSESQQRGLESFFPSSLINIQRQRFIKT